MKRACKMFTAKGIIKMSEFPVCCQAGINTFENF